MQKLYKILSLVMCACVALALAACGTSATAEKETAANTEAQSQEVATQSADKAQADKAQAADNGETVEFTDATGRVVTLPKKIERVASAGPLSNIAIYAINPDTLVGWSSAPSKSTEGYIDPKFKDLPEYGKFYGKKGNFNRESLMASNPQVVIDVGQWDEDYKKDLDQLQEQIGIPVICLDGTLEKNAETFRTLGKLLGNEEKGNKIADYTDKVLKDAKEKAAKIPADKRLKIYCGQDEDGLSTIIQNTIHTEAIEYVGGDVVVDKDSAQIQQGGGTVSLEQILDWDPDVILFIQNSIYDKVKDDPSWSALKAIQNGKYYEIPNVPYNWLNRPPGPNRIIGIVWLGNLLYPDVFDYDVRAETKEFYDIMYNKKLTDKEVDELLAKSTIKAQAVK